MGYLKKPSYTKPLPADAVVVAKGKALLARWTARGEAREAPVVEGRDGSRRIRGSVATWHAHYIDHEGAPPERRHEVRGPRRRQRRPRPVRARGRADPRRPLQRRREPPGRADHALTVSTGADLALILAEQGDAAAALPIWRAAQDSGMKVQADPATTARLNSALAQASLALQQWPEAEAACRRRLAIREATDPNAWETFDVRSMLGGVLLGRGASAEAGPLLRSGTQGW